MNVVREIQKINDLELREGISGPASWHYQYKDSAWVYVGGLSEELTEGDLLCIMSQWGEIEDCNLVRDRDTGKSKCFAFVKFCDQYSTILAVDNFTGAQLLGRTLRVDHVQKYRLPKELREKEEEEGGQPQQWQPGHAYEGKEHSGEATFQKGTNIWEPSEDNEVIVDDESGDDGMDMNERRKKKEAKKGKRHKVKKKDREKRKMEKKEKIMTKNSQLCTNQQPSIPEIKPKRKATVSIPDAIVQSATAQAGGVADWRGLRTSGSAVGGGYSVGGRQGKEYRNDEDKKRKDKDPYHRPDAQGVPELYASNRTTHHHGMGGLSRHR